jgi:hypothetical protein
VHKVKPDTWCVGYFSEEDDPSRRLTRPLLYFKRTEDSEEYNVPIEGLSPLIDLVCPVVVIVFLLCITYPYRTAWKWFAWMITARRLFHLMRQITSSRICIRRFRK